MTVALAIARQTFLEVIRRPIHAVVVLATLVGYVLSPWLALFSLREEERLLLDFGSSTLLLAGWILTCLAASGVVREEIETRTTLALFAKPVTREAFLVGKFLGVAAALLLVITALAMAFLLASRTGAAAASREPLDLPAFLGLVAGVGVALLAAAARSYRGRSFGSAFSVTAAAALGAAVLAAGFLDPSGGAQRFGAGFHPLVPSVALLALLALLVLASFAVALSAWAGRGGTFLLTALLFLLGLLAPDLPEPWRSVLAVFPDFRTFWTGELFYLEDPVLPAAHVAIAGVYAGCYIGLFLALGVLALKTREL